MHGLSTSRNTHTQLYRTSYSHLRRCWFLEMLQVRCHVHRSPGSKLRPLHFFPLTCLPSLSLFSDKHFHVTLFAPLYFPCVQCSRASFAVRANKVSSERFIISNTRAIAQVLIWAAALYESHPVLTGWINDEICECSPNHFQALFPSGREKAEWLSSNQTLSVPLRCQRCHCCFWNDWTVIFFFQCLMGS